MKNTGESGLPGEGHDREKEDDLYEFYRITVDAGQQPLRVDKFLTNRLERMSRNRIQNAAKAGAIRVNGTEVKPNYKVKPHDEVVIVLEEEPQKLELIPEDIPLDIIYEDDHLIVVNKPAGLVVHPGHGNYSSTLVNALLFHFDTLPEGRGAGAAARPGLVHRLDKETTGLMVVAKKEYAMTHLAKQFFDRTIKREYVALVWGDFEETEGKVETFIGRNLRDRQKMDVFDGEENGKYALTHYWVLERFGYVSLIKCKLATGRTHQIRVHMKHINHPIFNDSTYGGDRIVKGTVYTKYKQFIENCFGIMKRQALHARSLGFVHPETKQEMYFETDLPTDFQKVLEKWNRYTKGLNIDQPNE